MNSEVLDCIQAWQNDPDPDDMIEELTEEQELPVHYKLVVLLTMYYNCPSPRVVDELNHLTSELDAECDEQDCYLTQPIENYIVEMVDRFYNCFSDLSSMEAIRDSDTSALARQCIWDNYSEDGTLTLYAGVRDYRAAMLDNVEYGYSWTNRPPISTTPNWDLALHQFTDDSLIQVHFDEQTWLEGDPYILPVWALTAQDQSEESLTETCSDSPYAPLEWLILPEADLVVDEEPYEDWVTYTSLVADGGTWVEGDEVEREVTIYNFYSQ